MKSDLTNRLSEAVAYLKGQRIIKTQKDIATEMGMNVNTISQAIKGNKRYLTESFIVKFCATFEKINTKYVLYGQGELTTYDDSEHKKEINSINFDDLNVMFVPLISKYAYLDFLENFDKKNYTDSLPKIPFIKNNLSSDNYLCFEIKNDNMDNGEQDAIMEGDILLCKNINKEYWNKKLQINKWDFVVIHKSKGIIVSRITNHNINTNEITLHNLNDYYNDETINLNDVVAVYNVEDLRRKRQRR